MSLINVKAWIRRSTESVLARNTLWMLLSQGFRVLMQAIYFIIVARALGVEQYGAFVSVSAFAAIVAPFVSIGRGDLLIKNVSRNRGSFSEYWGNALAIIAFSSMILITCTIVLNRFLPTTVPFLVVLLVCISDLLFLRILDIAGQAFQSVQLLSKTAQINVFFSLARLLAALVLVVFFNDPGIVEWSFLYLISTAIPAILAILLVHRILEPPKLALAKVWPEIKEGFYFSISLSSQTIYNDIDKTMLAQLSTLESTGIYAAAYRLIDVAFTPVRSLLYASYAKFFQHGSDGIIGSTKFARKLLPLAVVYGLASGIGLLILAPIVPYFLGAEYGTVVEALRWLSPLILLKATHYLAADALTGAGFQGLRSGTQVLVATFNVVLNLWLLPLFSWRGAAWSSLLSDTLLLICLWSLVFLVRTKSLNNASS